MTISSLGLATLIATARAGEALDALCWRMLGQTAGAVEAALALNPGLSAAVLLTEGTTVTLPVDAAPNPRETVQLWA